MESWNFSCKTLAFSDETSPEILCLSPNSSSPSLSGGHGGSSSSSLFALNLGTTVDRNRRRRFPAESSSPATRRARTRTRGCYSQTTPFCQALGCNKDLSDSKEYHKKHRVCDLHSKSPKVVINGVEQRFCQQCSRFHLLCEFDDGKRSCRRRLAGHNERRRKPQFDGLSNKPQKFSHSFQDDKYLETSLQKRPPFVFSDILSNTNLSELQDRHFTTPFGHIKFEDDPIFGASHYQTSFGPITHSPSIPEDYLFVPEPLLQNNKPLGDSSIIGDAPCALSLLSSLEPHNHNHSHHHDLSGDQTDLIGRVVFPDPTHREIDDCYAPDRRGSTVDLIQLSTHLHRVENQRSFSQVKQENDDFCFFQTV